MKTKLHFTKIGVMLCLLASLSFLQAATDYTMTLDDVQTSAYWTQTNKWDQNDGYYPGQQSTDDTATITTAGTGNKSLNINTGIDIKKLDLLGTTGLQMNSSLSSNSIKIGTLINKGSSTVQLFSNEGSSLYVDIEIKDLDLWANNNTFALGTSSSSLSVKSFKVTGTTKIGVTEATAGTYSYFENASGKRLYLGETSLGQKGYIVTSGGSKEGSVEVSSLTGAGIIYAAYVSASPASDFAGTFTLNNTNDSPVTFSGRFVDGSNNGKAHLALEKKGAGTQILSGASSHTGGTTISSGTLLITTSGTSNSGTGKGDVLVKDTGILGGTGYIYPDAGKNIVIESVLSPGIDGEGILNFRLEGASKLKFETGSMMQMTLDEISSNGVKFYSAGDWLDGSGKVTLALTLKDGFDYHSTYVVFENVTTINFAVANVTGYDSVNYAYQFERIGNNYVVSFNAIPEPHLVGLLALSLTLFLAGSRFKRRRNEG